mmetsp:Transcript_22594/g.57445  ORF Transcript_22594/g.57445 Transcript_22594/m.57445 type:complete len:287 (+) Transcript_22594:42-902(+)|eukprot:CAMPEP_0202860790 /NCGR_PEP_ID=MMETSP1391-20130828/2392_1 /ASSEMBLY_ACC=CAM_ASM_000867 /TAXON_ID=1034604 /ORGANISM="Chlamydomonas leiostraca, Strain SAG 11-49" /LENGTH=286 /DNA_ID=CAMNT_0049540045 /DNA_START=38 /DNA_END=898 /DNA_ORIENTATION=-
MAASSGGRMLCSSVFWLAQAMLIGTSLGQLCLMGTITPWPMNFAPKGWVFCRGQLLPINQNQALFSILGTMYGGNGQTTFALPDLRGRVPIGATSPYGGAFIPGQAGGQDSISLSSLNLPPHTHQTPPIQADNTTDTPEGVLSSHSHTYTVPASGGSHTHGLSVTVPTVTVAPGSASVVSRAACSGLPNDGVTRQIKGVIASCATSVTTGAVGTASASATVAQAGVVPQSMSGDTSSASGASSGEQAIPHRHDLSVRGNSQSFSILRPYIGMNYILCTQGIYPTRS